MTRTPVLSPAAPAPSGGYSQGIVVTEDFEDEDVKNGKVIRYIPLWEFLLGADQNNPNAAR